MGGGVTTDSFHYAYQSLMGDGTIIARLSPQETGKFGLMIRQDLTPESPFVELTLLGATIAKFEYRTTMGMNAAQVYHSGLPHWLKLTRVGNVFNGYMSPDGVTWTQVGSSQNVPLSSSVYIGLGVCAKDIGTLKTEVFDNISMTP